MKQKQLLLALILTVAFGVRLGYSLAKGIGREPGDPSHPYADDANGALGSEGPEFITTELTCRRNSTRSFQVNETIGPLASRKTVPIRLPGKPATSNDASLVLGNCLKGPLWLWAF